jgi:23S rRNA pseudouridine1911/1915/1917 synthase
VDQIVSFTVGPEHEGQRIDRLLAALYPQISRSEAASLIEAGMVRINGRPCKPASKPVEGAEIETEFRAARRPDTVPENIPLQVVYEDESLVVVDKPAGMVVHPAPGNLSGTLVNALLGRYATLPGDPVRPGIVHRLDKDTSGLMVVARTQQAVAALARAFKQRQVHKEYVALVIGQLEPPAGVLSGDIGRDSRYRQRMAVLAAGGREARTHYRTEEALGHYSLLRIVLETGRMHQIRVHFSAIGHPIVGDPVYGRRIRGLSLQRQFLHAAQLSFRHPATGEELAFASDLPLDLATVLEQVRSIHSRLDEGKSDVSVAVVSGLQQVSDAHG